MANGITTIRLLLLYVLVAMLYLVPAAWGLLNVVLLVIIFVLDGVDGYVARRRHEETTFGALYDIAADRVIELVLWIVLTNLGHTPVWVPIVFCSRGVLVDVVRTHAAARGATPYGMMHTRLGRWIVAGRFMRILYAAAKTAAFGWILLIAGWPEAQPELWSAHSTLLLAVQHALVCLAVALCVLRGVPVLYDAALSEFRKATSAGPSSERRP